MKKEENKEKNYGFETLSDEELELIFGGQSLTQPASVSGTLGQTVTISCTENSDDDYYCSPTADSLFKNGQSVPRKAGRPHRKR